MFWIHTQTKPWVPFLNFVQIFSQSLPYLSGKFCSQCFEFHWQHLQCTPGVLWKARNFKLGYTAWIFSLYFQLPYLPEETCFQQAGPWKIPVRLCWDLLTTTRRYQPACHYFKKVKKSQLWKKDLSYRPFSWFSTCSLSLPTSGTDLKSRKGLCSGPSPIPHIGFGCWKGDLIRILYTTALDSRLALIHTERKSYKNTCTEYVWARGSWGGTTEHGNLTHRLQLSLFLRL